MESLLKESADHVEKRKLLKIFCCGTGRPLRITDVNWAIFGGEGLQANEALHSRLYKDREKKRTEYAIARPSGKGRGSDGPFLSDHAIREGELGPDERARSTRRRRSKLETSPRRLNNIGN